MKLLMNAAFMSVVRIVALLSSAGISILTARLLGPSGRGVYVLPAIDTSLALTLMVGLSSGIAYFLINRKVGRSIVPSALAVFAVFTIGASLLTIGTAALNHSTWALIPALLQTASYAAYSIACGYYMGRDRVRAAGLLNAVGYVTTLVFVAVALLAIKASAAAAITAWVASWILTGTVGLILVLRDARRLEGSNVAPLELLRFASKAGLLNIANLLNYRVDIFIVAMLLPVASVGIYTIAVLAAESALSLTFAIGQVTLPRIGGSTRAEAGVFAARCLRNSVFLALVLALTAFVLAPLVVRIVLGPAFAGVVLPFRILVIGVVAASTGAVISNYFMLNLGRTHVPLAISTVSTVLCAGFSFALVPRVGLTGAALASTIAYIASQALAVVWFCKESGINISDVLLINREDVAVYRRIVRHATLRLS